MFAKVLLLPLLASLALASPITKRDSEGKRIRSLASPDLCLTVQNGYAAYGTKVAMTGCSQGEGGYLDQFQFFSAVGPQRGQIKLISNEDMCLDADTSNGNGGQISIEACEDGKDSQVFTVGTTGTGSEPNLRLAIGSSESQCLDVVKDSTPSYQKPYGYTKDLQSWECHPTDHPDAQQQYFELVASSDS
ncbi:hypothetical protein I302_103512 [Kwoniella bestiolae CBS 10118]|uniref:Ricin B lectin domain-containing protein n=1 Tax=Kwoniella bestiolae CBS 10118 TaxID=1296100 RepID=A0A1B9G8N7_9TREE|nr:hypothetical protein I302_02214 [Kwoniella bestiolae CBS 10118]OCF27373.1 hypothetical protein I302_02214 [Kwoniella bestiolae CBS 10118]